MGRKDESTCRPELTGMQSSALHRDSANYILFSQSTGRIFSRFSGNATSSEGTRHVFAEKRRIISHWVCELILEKRAVDVVYAPVHSSFIQTH